MTNSNVVFMKPKREHRATENEMKRLQGLLHELFDDMEGLETLLQEGEELIEEIEKEYDALLFLQAEYIGVENIKEEDLDWSTKVQRVTSECGKIELRRKE